MKYLKEDLNAVISKEKNLDDVAKKYGVSRANLVRRLNRQGYHIRRRKIKIVTPYKTVVVNSIQECADTLKLSTTTIKLALKGQRIKTLEELNIHLEVKK